MKKIIFAFGFLMIALVSCNSSNEKYQVKKYFSDQQRDSLLVRLVPYFADLLYSISEDEKFDSVSREKYRKVLFNWSFEKFYKTEDSTYYFMIWEMAPSIGNLDAKEKIAIAGRYRLNSQHQIIDFEEIFNTPKMPQEALKEKGDVLFDEMVTKKGDMSKYIGNQEMIEFPDAHVCYDKKKTKWKVCVPYK